MQIMHFILDKIPKLLTYCSIISGCKVIWSQKQSGFFGPPCTCTFSFVLDYVTLIRMSKSISKLNFVDVS